MGTSADRDGGKGGPWSPLKRASTAYAKTVGSGSGGGDSDAARLLLGRHVAIFGGAGPASNGARTGKSTLAALGGFLASVGSSGLQNALHEVGLGHLVGRDRFDVLDELVTLMTGDASDLESQAARDAQCDVMDELFGDAEAWGELDAISISAERLEALLAVFVARYVYNRVPTLPERLARIMDPAAVKEADRQIVELIQGVVDLQMPETPLTFDWSGQAGRDFADQAINDIYRILESSGDADL